MFKYLKSDLYVMSKMKATYILPIIAFLLIAMSAIIYLRVDIMALFGGSSTTSLSTLDYTKDSDEPMSEQYSQVYSESFSAGFDAGYTATGDALETGSDEVDTGYETPKFSKLFSGGLLYDSPATTFAEMQLRGLTGALLVSIFGVFLFSNWLRGGLSKNILKGNSNRFIPFFSKVITLFIYNLAFTLFILLTSFFFVAIMGKSFDLGMTKEFAGYFVLNTFMSFAFACLVIMIATLTKSTALSMAFALICGTGSLSMIIMLIELFINHVILDDGKVSLTEYMISGNLQSLSSEAARGSIIRGVIVTVVYMVVSLVIASFVYRKRDIH